MPQPNSKQALVRIRAVSLNFRDLLILDHSPAYPSTAKNGLVPCSDGSGVVEEAGPESTWKKGDRVVLQSNTWNDGDTRNFVLDEVYGGSDRDGTLRRFMVVDDAQLLKIPKNWSFAEAATLFTGGVTAARAMFFGPIRAEAGVTVVTQGTGGVSCYAIQLAAAAGATVIATSSSDDKLELVKQMGATHLINYRKTPDWASEVQRLTDGKGADHVFDVGGAGTIEQSLQATRQSGVVTVVGVLTESKSADIIPAILFGDKTVTGHIGAGNKKMFQFMIDFINEHTIRPVIAKEFDFDEAKEAFEYLRNLSKVGKVVINC